MISFFVMVMLVLLSMNAYWVWRVYAAFPQMGWWVLAPAGWALLMTSGPFWMRSVPELRWASVVVYLWLAIMWWFLVAALVMDGWNGVAWLGGMKWPAFRSWLISPQVRFLVATFLVVLAVVWGLIEARNIQIREVTIETPRLPPGTAPLRVVMFSDVHMGLTMSESHMRHIAERLRQAEPDVLICGGDLTDGGIDEVRSLAAHLKEVPAPLGRFAVLGNHEVYTGLGETQGVLDFLNLKLLRGQCVQVTPLVRICGVDDPAVAQRGNQPAFMDENAVLPADEARGKEGLVLLVKHRPEVHEPSIGRFDVQLSGHSHGGQIWPFHVFSAMSNEYLEGLHELGEGSWIFVSRGAGTWGPPVRLLAPPDVLVVIFKPVGQ